MFVLFIMFVIALILLLFAIASNYKANSNSSAIKKEHNLEKEVK